MGWVQTSQVGCSFQIKADENRITRSLASQPETQSFGGQGFLFKFACIEHSSRNTSPPAIHTKNTTTTSLLEDKTIIFRIIEILSQRVRFPPQAFYDLSVSTPTTRAGQGSPSVATLNPLNFLSYKRTSRKSS